MVPAGGASGVIFAEGGRYGGFALYVKNNRLIYENNAQGHAHEKIVSLNALPQGPVHIEYEFQAHSSDVVKGVIAGLHLGSGRGLLSVNGTQVGEGPITSFGAFGGETFDVGADFGSPVGDDAYETPFTFTGTLKKGDA